METIYLKRFFTVRCSFNREMAQIANAFIDQFQPDETLLDRHPYMYLITESEFDTFCEAMATYIKTKDSRMGEPGFLPDLVYYINEYVEENDLGWWSYDLDYCDPVCDFLYKAAFAWNDAVTGLITDTVDNEEYVIDNYGLEAGDYDWPYNDLDYCIDSAFDNDNAHGFQSRDDLKYVLKECMDRDKLHQSVYHAGGMGYHCVDGEDYCETGSVFLGNGEESLELDWWGIEPLFDLDKLPHKFQVYNDGVTFERNFSVMNDECYVSDDFKYGYLTLDYLIFFFYDWKDVIETALENGFYIDEEKNIIRKEEV